MFKKQKQFVFILLLLLPLFSLFADEVDYPTLPNTTTPTPEEGLPSYVNYIFNLALAIGGLVAFGVLIWGGVLYLTSAGNPEQIGNAKKKLIGALSGLFILFAVYLILFTINPDFVVTGISFFQDMSILQPSLGVCLCPSTSPCTRTCDGENNFFVTNSQVILDLPTDLENEKWEVKFYSKNPLIYIFNEEGYQGEWTSRKKLNGEFVNFFPKSIYFANPNGVCLYDHIVADEKDLMHFPEHFVCLDESTPNLGLVEPFFDDKAQAVIIYGNYAAILFEEQGYKGNYAMVCENKNAIDVKNLEESEENNGYCWGVEGLVSNNPPIGNNKVSSVEVWKDNKENKISGNIIFYNRPDCKGGEYQVSNQEVSIPGIVDISEDSDNVKFFSDGKKVFENIVSIKINGTFALILEDQPDGKGNAQLFKKPQGSNCIPSLVGSSVFDSTPESPDPGYQTKKIRRIIVVPARE